MKARFAITALVALLIFFAGYAALFIAPDEATMHAIQRIFYFHVASWNAMFCAFFVAFYASVAYLVNGKRKWTLSQSRGWKSASSAARSA
jgi:heme exporter protein C